MASASDNDPVQLPPLEARLDDLMLLSTNNLWVRLTFDDETDIDLEFRADSPVAHEVIELLTRAATERFQRLGQRGVTITGFTPPEADEES